MAKARQRTSVHMKYSTDVVKNSYGVMNTITVFVDKDGNEYVWCHDKNAKTMIEIDKKLPNELLLEYEKDKTIDTYDGRYIYRIIRPRVIT